MNNLDWYNSFASVPENAKKPITAGKLKGKTDINPMWRIRTLTETFGPCGFGWTTRIIEHWVEQDGNESAAWVRIELRVKFEDKWSEPIEGVGGSKQFGKGMGDGINDEAFKMAETDAISVACKKLGIGADVYWQANETKYNQPANDDYAGRSTTRTRAKPQPQPQPQPEKQCLVKEMLDGGALQPLEDWLVAQYDNQKAHIPREAIQVLHDQYLWDTEDTFNSLVLAAQKKAFVEDLNTKQ